MRKNLALTAALLWGVAWGVGTAVSVASEPHVSGLQPFQRPDWAPSVGPPTRSSDWYARALTGISKPYPASLRFLEDQGNWYTPFDRPGMLPPYDIRGWHAQ